MVPSSVTQLLVTVLFVVPGFVYQAARISIRGRLPADIELSTRIVRAIVSSVIFGLVYLVVAGEVLIDAAHGSGFMFTHPRLGALVAIAGGIAIPGLAGLVGFPHWKWMERLEQRLPEIRRYDPTPTAWDKTFQDSSECFVRILNKESRWIAGFYGASSYATSYPESHQLFLERAYKIDDGGVIGEEIEGSRGCLVDCNGIQLLEILEAYPPDALSQAGRE